MDTQTLSGKTIAGVLKAANEGDIPVAALCGSVTLSTDELEAAGVQYAASILNQVGSLEEAKRDSFKNLEMASYNFANVLKTTRP